ncbi:NLI interacting factor-like phosphatase-domain-containing protein [Thermoascus aurantiacus ATCC 26904]
MFRGLPWSRPFAPSFSLFSPDRTALSSITPLLLRQRLSHGAAAANHRKLRLAPYYPPYLPPEQTPPPNKRRKRFPAYSEEEWEAMDARDGPGNDRSATHGGQTGRTHAQEENEVNNDNNTNNSRSGGRAFRGHGEKPRSVANPSTQRNPQDGGGGTSTAPPPPPQQHPASRRPRRSHRQRQRQMNNAVEHRRLKPDAPAFEPSRTMPTESSSLQFNNNNNAPGAPGLAGLNLLNSQNLMMNAMNMMNMNNNPPGLLPFTAPNMFMGGAFQQQFLQQLQQQQQQQQQQLQPGPQGFTPGPFGVPQLNNFIPPFNPFMFTPTAAMMAAFQPGMNLQMPNAPSAPIVPDPASSAQTAPNGAVDAGAATPEAPKRGVQPVEVPVVTEKYMAQASLPPKEISPPQPLLVILDINGTLIYRKHRRLPPQFVKRPGLDKFLDTLLEKYTVMIWSSSQPQTVNAVCERLFPKKKRAQLAAEWARDKFGLTHAQYREKIQVYKRLEKVWADESIQARYPRSKNKLGKLRHAQLLAHQADPDSVPPPLPMRWDQSNTVLIDDSRLKAAAQPYNILEIPEFTNDPNSKVDESQVFKNVLKRLNILARRDDVSKMLRHWEMQKQQSGGGAGLDGAADLDELDDMDDIDDDEDGGVEVGNNHQSNNNDNSNNNHESENASGANNVNGETTTTTTTAVDPVAEARRERRRARKREKKAARRAAKEKAKQAAAVTAQQQQVQQQPLPSPPSPVSSVSEEAEHFLLDRLEEPQQQPPPQPQKQTA